MLSKEEWIRMFLVEHWGQKEDYGREREKEVEKMASHSTDVTHGVLPSTESQSYHTTLGCWDAKPQDKIKNAGSQFHRPRSHLGPWIESISI